MYIYNVHLYPDVVVDFGLVIYQNANMFTQVWILSGVGFVLLRGWSLPNSDTIITVLGVLPVHVHTSYSIDHFYLLL